MTTVSRPLPELPKRRLPRGASLILSSLAFFIALLAQALAAAPGLVTPNDMGTGSLLFRSTEPGRFIEAPRLASDFNISVTGLIARTRVTQQFENPAAGWVEGVYVFPLPEGAAVDTLKMVVGNRVIVGDIRERQEAKQIYEAAKAAGQKAALLEQERPNMFTTSVANIGPGDRVVIQIEYQEAIRQSGGEFGLRVPMVVGPRYNPAPDLIVGAETETITISDPVPDRDRISPPVLDPRLHGPVNPVTLTLRLAPGFPVSAVQSHHHEIVAEAQADGSQTLSLVPGTTFADRDFELTFRAALGAEPAVGLFHERAAGQDYVLAMISPPAAMPAAAPAAREAIFVIDNSGSMGGPSMAQARNSLLYALSRLAPEDRFNVIRFDDTMEQLFTTAVPATRDNVETARAFVSRLEAEGGTEMLPPLKAALADTDPAGKDHVRQVVFLTDGAIGNEQEMFDALAQRRGRSRVFMVGIGSAPNSFLMSRMAEIGRGSFTHIGESEQVETRMRELFAKLENPAVTDIRVAFDDGTAAVTPDVMPDLYQGEPLVVLARLSGLGGGVTVSGRIGDRQWTTRLQLTGADPGQGIARLWARRKIDSAEVAVAMNEIAPEEADRRVLALALEHHLVSRRTSLVAVDTMPGRPREQKLSRAEVPLNLPAGWDFDKVFGEPVKTRHAGLALKQLALTEVARGARQAEGADLVLPQTGTGSALAMLLGLLALALAVLVACLPVRRALP
jgi:Ca-activated chloride channel family protein